MIGVVVLVACMYVATAIDCEMYDTNMGATYDLSELKRLDYLISLAAILLYYLILVVIFAH